MREITRVRTSEQHLLAYGIAIFVCVFLGPFDTDVDLSFEDRLVFWTVAVVAVGTVMEACFVAVLESKWLSWMHIAPQLVLGGMIGAVPGTAFVRFINQVFRPEHLQDASFLVMWGQVAVMGLLVAGLECLIWYRLQLSADTPGLLEEVRSGPKEPAEDRAADDAALAPSRLSKRLSDRLRLGQIISLSMQDHYVEVTTTLGSEMLLMRLSDAIDLLDGLDGAQTHRSHWAARAHATGLEKAERRHELVLSDGRRLPVSKSYLDDVRQMLNEKSRPEPALI